jgi:protein SCO1
MSDEERFIQDESEDFEGDVPPEQEASLLNLRTLVISIGGLIGMIIFILLISGAIFALFRSSQPPAGDGIPTSRVTERPPQAPGLQQDPAQDLLRLRETEQARLQGYGWVNQEEGWVHIPVKRAMELLAEQGLPVEDDPQPPMERIEARESGFPHPTQIPPDIPGTDGTSLLEITLSAEMLETPTAEPDPTGLNPTEAPTPDPALSGTPAVSLPVEEVSFGSENHSEFTNPLEAVRYDQRMNNQIPLDTQLNNEAGQQIRLGDFFGDKPIVMVFAYYECPMLCTLVLNDLTRALRSVDLEIGNQFEVITVSIDPRETSELAAAKKRTYLNEYGRPGAEPGWHFLTGEENAIQALTEAAGFQYMYDEELDQYAHPAGIFILTPSGRIARYLLGIEYSPNDLRLGLVEASAGKISTPIDQFFLLCYTYDPVTGRYTLVIENVLKIAGGATVLLISTMVLGFVWRERRRNNRHSP